MNRQQPQLVDPQQANQLLLVTFLLRRARFGANNFHWIAVLSLVNSLISAFGGHMPFVIGLGVTQLVDGIVMVFAIRYPSVAALIRVMGLMITLGISALFFVFGYFTIRRKQWVFIAGMMLYGIDALILLTVQDWIGVLFHAFFLWALWSGLQALNRLQKTPMPAIAPVTDFPQKIDG